ncbi:MAG: hypothetical protein ACUVTG_06350 [Candidatus Oleimicrobiaceae bacterium]
MQRGKQVSSPLSLVVAAAQVTLVGVAMAQGSGGPQWSVPKVVARDLRMPWLL